MHADHEAASEHQRWHPSPHVLVAFGAFVLLVVFAVLNRDRVAVDVIVDSVRMRLVVVIAIAAVLAFLVGWSFGRHRSR